MPIWLCLRPRKTTRSGCGTAILFSGERKYHKTINLCGSCAYSKRRSGSPSASAKKIVRFG